MPMLIGVAIAIGLALLLRETGPKARKSLESSRHLPGFRPNENPTEDVMSTLIMEPEHKQTTEDRAAFKPGLWTKEIDVRNFIQHNYEPYYGDGASLRVRPSGPSASGRS